MHRIVASKSLMIVGVLVALLAVSACEEGGEGEVPPPATSN